MDRRNKMAAAVLAACLMFFVGACGEPTEPTLGVILPETGIASTYAPMIRAGMDLAMEQVNAAGGINGTPLKLIYKNSASDPATGVAVARELIEQDRVARPRRCGDRSSRAR